MTLKPIQILFVEDFPDDAILIARRMGQYGLKVEYDIVDTEHDLSEALRTTDYDIVLCDYNVPGLYAYQVLTYIGSQVPELPVIIVSGSIGEEQAADLMRVGASDIVLKPNLGRLAPAIEREISGRTTQAQLVERADQSERQFRDTFDAAPVAMCWLSLDHRYIRTNRAFQNLFGYSADELSRLGPADTSHPAAFLEARHHVEEILSGKLDHVEIETRHLHKDGHVLWLWANIAMMHDGDGAPEYLLVHLQDITARKTAEEQLFQAQKMEAIGNFAGGIAHDFNNMLLPIIGLTEMTREDLTVESPHNENLELVLEAAGKARSLVQQILTFSRQGETAVSALDLSACAGDALSLLRSILPSTIKIIDSIPSDVGLVLADNAQIQSVVMNLGSNAAAAIGNQVGELRIDLDRIEAGAERVGGILGLASGTFYARLSIVDSGAGIDAPTLAKIFNPFFTTKAPGEGTGLGLSMVHGIVERYGGIIDVSSQVGVGTRFDIYLPLLNDPPFERLTR